MKHTLKFIFSLSFCFFSLGIIAQDKPTDTLKTNATERYGLRIGADLHRLSKLVYDKRYKGFELVGDYRINRKWYLAAEIGNEEKTTDELLLNFTTQGTYLKAGFDYNAYENWLGMENMIYAGLRYGASSFSHQLNRYSVYNTQPYFDTTTVYPNTEFKGLTASWLEVVGGVKAELFRNLYLSFSVRLNYLVTQKKPANFDNLYIPGFNRTYEGNFGTGFNYTLSYMIPFYKGKK